MRLATGTAFEAPRCIDSYKWTDRITALIDHDRDSTADVLVHGLSEDTLGRGYDAFGRIGSVHYPSTPLGGVDITYAYAGDGSLDRVLRGGATLWEAKDFDASGRGTLEQLGNGAFVSRAYDAATGRLRDIESYLMVAGDVFPEKVAFQHLSYTQYADGQPSSRVDHITGLTETFTYDDADRLVAWSQTGASGTGSFGLTYDALGNMTSSICPDGAHAYGHGVGAGPHAVTSIDGTVISYDGAGRRTSDPAGTITYTPFDLPREITSAAGTTSFGYDAFGARVTKQSPADTTVYVGGIYERRTGGEESHHFYVRAANRVVAEIVESGGTQDIRYLHPDHLGSTQVLTDGAGAVLERRWYTPFGQLTTAMPTGGDRHTGGFTGHESDFAERLVDMRGRIYDPATRRFLTPDPIIGRPQLGQNFNRYAYVLNAPLTYVDPTGLDGGSPDDSCGQCDFDDEEGTYINVEQEEQEQQEEREGAPDYEPDGADFEPDYDVDYDPGSGYQDSDDYGYDDAYGNSRDGQPAPVPTGGQTRQSSETTLFEAATEFLSGIGDWVGDHVSYGTTVQATVVAPILSGGGGHLGLNAQVVPGEGKSGLFAVTTPNENFPVGVGAGVSIGANVAIGEGAWSGAFREIDAGPVALFWSPGEGGWVGGPQ